MGYRRRHRPRRGVAGHGNPAPDNIWAIPTCFLVPALSALFVAPARRRGTFSPPVPSPVRDAVAV